jgi:hypothetical protein
VAIRIRDPAFRKLIFKLLMELYQLNGASHGWAAIFQAPIADCNI